MTGNEIRFECQHRGDGGPLVIVSRIDGAPLTELIDGRPGCSPQATPMAV
ncbi:hypothetical protein [Streptomyces sp900116325]